MAPSSATLLVPLSDLTALPHTNTTAPTMEVPGTRSSTFAAHRAFPLPLLKRWVITRNKHPWYMENQITPQTLNLNLVWGFLSLFFCRNVTQDRNKFKGSADFSNYPLVVFPSFSNPPNLWMMCHRAMM